MTTEENDTDLKDKYSFQQPRLLRGHPRWAPTNNPKDINCFHFLIPLPKRSYAKKQYMWLTQRNDLNELEDKKRLRNELMYYGSLMDCIRLKYLAKSEMQTTKTLIERYGPNEPYNTELYKSNHIFTMDKFRERPPKYFDDETIPTWRYKQLKYESIHSLANMEYEWIHKQKKKWKRYYKYCWIRGKIKKFITNKINQSEMDNNQTSYQQEIS
eukprot:29144_1